ncbi:hypothetical protein [Ruegeria sp.]|uniref:hypothetical protein n=1 Tax=Ruegeria sp. TaxID=1879320 RepID=UPI003B5BBA99
MDYRFHTKQKNEGFELFNFGRFFTVALLAATPGILAAQEVTGAATLGFGTGDISGGGGDFGSFTADAVATVNFENGLFWGLGAKYVYIDPDDVPGDETIYDFDTSLNYQFSTGAVIGAYFEYADDELDTGLGFDLSGSTTSYGVSGGYVADGVGFEAWIGQTDTSPSLPGGDDFLDYGALVRYQPTEEGVFGAHLARSDVSVSGIDLDLYSLGFGGRYQFGPGWGAFGGISHQSLADFDVDATTFGVGVDYNFINVIDFPLQLSVELSRTNLDAGGADADIDTLRFGLTVPFDGRTSATPLNSVARAAMAPRYNTYNTLVDTAF